MARKAGSEEHREALARLKERHDAEVAAHGEYFAIVERRARLEAELAGIEVEQATALAAWVDVADTAAVGRVLGWSPNKVRAAVKLANVDDGGSDASGAMSSGVHTAAVVA